MFYVEMQNGEAMNVLLEGREAAAMCRDFGRTYETRNDWKTFERAAEVAVQLTAALAGRLFIPTDAGPNVSPRYDVIEAPRVGDKVSYSFNGDSYPDGEIVRVTPGSLRLIKTSTGSVYYRYRLSATWIKQGGTWALIQGHHNDRNPSF